MTWKPNLVSDSGRIRWVKWMLWSLRLRRRKGWVFFFLAFLCTGQLGGGKCVWLWHGQACRGVHKSIDKHALPYGSMQSHVSAHVTRTCTAFLANKNLRLFFNKQLGVLSLIVAGFVMWIYWKPLSCQLIIFFFSNGMVARLQMQFIIIK